MRFVIKQKIWSFGDDFVIKDEYGNEHFIVKGKVFSLGDKLRLYTMDGRELFYIEQKLFRFLPEYNIFHEGQSIATIKKDLHFLNLDLIFPVPWEITASTGISGEWNSPY